ncbi:MAG: hypothetical protein JXO44_11700 [Clostridia bacterium]|nr:hypothetical protein [Clostridia bacterium]
MKRYSSKTIIIMLICAMLIMVTSLSFIYFSAKTHMVAIIENQHEIRIETLGSGYGNLFDDGVQLTDLVGDYVVNRFDMNAYRENSFYVEGFKATLTKTMYNYAQNKNIQDVYFAFNPALTGRPNDVWLRRAYPSHSFMKLSENPVDYYNEYTEAQSWYYKAIESDGGVWLSPIYDEMTNASNAVCSYSQAVYKDGLLLGVSGVTFNTLNLESVANQNGDGDFQVWLADKTHHMVYHPLNMGFQVLEDYFGYLDIDYITKGEIGDYKGKGQEKIKVSRLDNGWFIGVTFFNTLQSNELGLFHQIIVAVTLTAILLLSGIAYIVSTRISDPLKRLTSEVGLIEAGNKEVNISKELMAEDSEVGHLATSIFKMVETKRHSYKEIGKQRDEIIHLYEETYAINADLENTLFQKEQLYDDLNVTFKKLEDANRELENRVALRTVELNEKNKALEHALKENKKNNRDLRKLNKDLEKSLKDLTMAQERLIESEKMVALGNMVSGIAHEINTPLGVSLTATSYILDQFEEIKDDLVSMTDEELFEWLQDVKESNNIIYESLTRSIELVGSFKEVAVNQHSNEKLAFDLLDYTHMVVRSLQHEYRHVVKSLEIDIPTDMEVYSYPGAYSQVVTNLIMNSIKHGFEGKEDGLIFIKAYAEKETIHMVFSDDGVGINQKDIKKVFEPFFTTKRARGGTGLGLSIVYNLVKTTLRGDISLQSMPGEGTSFSISFPIDVDKAGE